MKRMVIVGVMLINVFSMATSFLEAAKQGSAFDLSDLKKALPDGHYGHLQKIKDAAHAYGKEAVKEADKKDHKKIKQLEKEFLTTLQGTRGYNKAYVAIAFFYSVNSRLGPVVELLVTHQSTYHMLCKNKFINPALQNTIREQSLPILFDYLQCFDEVAEPNMLTCLQGIPDDCFANALGYLRGKTIFPLKTVNRAWNRLIYKRPYIVTSLDICEIPSASIEKLASYVPHIKSLKFNYADLLSFFQTGFRFEALSDIRVSCNYKNKIGQAIMQQSIEDKFFAHVFPHVKNMQLNCGGLPSSVVRAYIKNCKNLQKIGLRFGCDIEDADIKTIVEHSKDLRSIDLFQCKQITGGVIEMLARECKYLQEIDLGCCKLITNESVIALAQYCSKLQKVVLEGCHLVEDNGVITLAENCRGLREIDLYGCLRITNAAVIALAENCPLRAVYLTDCVQITDSAVIALAKRCPLQGIYLGSCRVTDTAIIALANHCPDLRVIYLAHCSFIKKDEAIAILVKNCKKLEYINLSDCKGIKEQYRLTFHGQKKVEQLREELLQSSS